MELIIAMVVVMIAMSVAVPGVIGQMRSTAQDSLVADVMSTKTIVERASVYNGGDVDGLLVCSSKSGGDDTPTVGVFQNTTGLTCDSADMRKSLYSFRMASAADSVTLDIVTSGGSATGYTVTGVSTSTSIHGSKYVYNSSAGAITIVG